MIGIFQYAILDIMFFILDPRAYQVWILDC